MNAALKLLKKGLPQATRLRRDSFIPETAAAIIFVTAMAVFLACGMATFRAVQQREEAWQWIAHTYEVRDALRGVLSTLTDAETGQRGFILTGEKRYLEPYNAAMAAIPHDLDEVANLTRYNPVQQQALGRLGPLTQAKVAELRETVALYEQGGQAAALRAIATDRGKTIMDRIRAEVAGMLEAEQHLLTARRAAEKVAEQRTDQVILFGLSALFVLLAVSAALFYRGLQRRPRPPLGAAKKPFVERDWPGYVVAVAGTAATAWLRWELGRSLGQDLPPYIVFYPVIIFSALLGGVGAGLVATVLSTGLVDYLFLQPTGSLWIHRPADMAGITLFIAVNLMMSVVTGALRTTYRRTEQQAAELARTIDLLDLANVLVRDGEDRITRWETGCQRLYGFTREEAIGRVSHDLLRTRFPEPLENIEATLLATGRWQGELRHTAKDGHHLIVASEWVLRREATGRPIAIIESHGDITERKAAEDLLRQSEERFRTLTEVSSQIVWTSTPCGEPAGDSPSWHEFTGRSLEQWKGWNWLDAIHPNDRQRVATAWRNALESVQPYHDEYRLLHLSGTYRYVQARAVPVRNSDGTVREWIGALTDITSAKRAESARNMLSAVLADSDDAVIAKDLEGRITSWNRGAERLFGYSAEQMLGKHIRVLIPPERQEEEDDILDAIRRGKRVEHYESKRQARDGRLIDVSITTSPIRDSTGQIVGASKIARDITERKRAEAIQARSKEELERLVRERTAELEYMSYSMVHDMRAPLRAMQGFATILEEECAGCLQDSRLDYCRRIRESANRLDRLITDALNYNKVVREELPVGPVKVARLLRGMIETYPNLQPTAADIQIELKELVVLGNESLLTQCFGNLLGNAVKFVPPGVRPQVRIWAEVQSPETGHRVRIWVQDNGIGIPKDAHEKIFGMFQRMHRESEYTGTGIGLSIVKKAVERMGGDVGVESETGTGSKFWIELPRAAEAENREQMEDVA